MPLNWIRPLLLVLATYFAIDLFLECFLRLAFAGGFDLEQDVRGLNFMLCMLGAHAIAVFAAGAAAAGTRGSVRPAIVAGGGLVAAVAGRMAAEWTALPIWFHVLVVLMTPSFLMLGIAWRRAGQEESP
jgi:hypothetical protein